MRKIRQYPKEMMEAAILAALGDMSLTQAAKTFNVPYSTLEKKVAARNKVEVEGLTPDEVPDGKEVLKDLIDKQGDVEKHVARRYAQKITIKDNKPIGIAMFSDLHFGGSGVDYKAIEADTKLVKDTDGFYAMGAGDYIDAWLGRLAHVQREQAVGFDEEIALLEHWFDEINEKMLVVVGGNHDIRIKNFGGIDYIKRILRGCTHLLYDADECVFTINLQKASWKFKIRHAWMGSSIYNATHGMERDPRFGDDDFDVGIGGHTHRGTLFREFMFHHRKRLAVLLGTYKFYDRYPIRLGFPRSPEQCSGALILYPDGRLDHCPDLITAARFLEFLRK